MPFAVMSPEEENQNLEAIVAMLNDASGPENDWEGKRYGHQDAVKLRRMVRAWQDVMRDYGATVWDVRRMKLTRQDRKDLERFTTGIQASVESDGNLRVLDDRVTPWDEAALQFTRLLRNSRRDRLCGPCPGENFIRLKRRFEPCGKWFVKKTRKEATTFCSRKCAGNAAKAAERKRAHNRLIERAEKALANYPKRPSRFRELTWKEWVSQDSGVSKRFLFEAERRGELSPPDNPPQRKQINPTKKGR